MSEPSVKRTIRTRADLEELAEAGRKRLYPGRIKLKVGMGTCGLAAGSGQLARGLREEVTQRGVDAEVSSTACIGLCQHEPLVDVQVPGQSRVLYGDLDQAQASILVEALDAGEVLAEHALLRQDEDEVLLTGEKRLLATERGLEQVTHWREHPFYGGQMRIAMRNCGIIDPDSIEEYIARGGYLALLKALTELEPEEIIDCVTLSGLRGRGGGGYPTGRKWASCRKAHGNPKYVICNADEGDPGAYMDRSILEGDPHTVLEGLIIGGYAIGSSQGYIYVRGEYPLARQKLVRAIEQAEELGLLGKDIFGSGFGFSVDIVRGGGAFVCGESTALTASIEGRVGEPRDKYIHTVESGLWEKPTVLNNVETWANVPPILMLGSEWFSSIGSEGSKGTKVFSLVGKVCNTGLIEVPMGISLREIIYDIGGGMPEGKQFKAVQTGGPSGGCIPAQHLDLPVDFDRLKEVGSMMGSGGMIVMDEDTCMVDVARYFMDFLREESCGKCTPCREGNQRMYQILERICNGEAQMEDLALLEETAEFVQNASLCALGTSAPNPVLSTVRYFRDEYEAHIRDKKCPAGVCKALISFSVDAEKCICCGRCAKDCPAGCITGKKGKPPARAKEKDRAAGKVGEPFQIDQEACIRCGVCFDACPADAIIRT